MVVHTQIVQLNCTTQVQYIEVQLWAVHICVLPTSVVRIPWRYRWSLWVNVYFRNVKFQNTHTWNNDSWQTQNSVSLASWKLDSKSKFCKCSKLEIGNLLTSIEIRIFESFKFQINTSQLLLFQIWVVWNFMWRKYTLTMCVCVCMCVCTSLKVTIIKGDTSFRMGMHVADWIFKYHAELLCYQSSASGNHTAGRLVEQVGQTYFQNDASALTLTSWIDSDFIHPSTCAIQLASFPGYLVQFTTINVYTYLWHPMLPIVYRLWVQNLAILQSTIISSYLQIMKAQNTWNNELTIVYQIYVARFRSAAHLCVLGEHIGEWSTK